MMAIYENANFEFPGYFWRTGVPMAFCHVRIYSLYNKNVIVVTEHPLNEGLSVTNGIERIASRLLEQNIIPDMGTKECIFVEHYIAGRKLNPSEWEIRDCPETFDIVELNPTNKMVGNVRLFFERPSWKPFSKNELEELIGYKFADCF